MDLLTIILLMLTGTNIMVYIFRLQFNKLKDRVEHLTNWAEELEKWIEEGGDAYMGLNFDIDLAREEIREEIMAEINNNKNKKGDK